MAPVINAAPAAKPAVDQKEAEVKKPGALETGYKTYVVDFVSANSCKCIGDGFSKFFGINEKDGAIASIAKTVFGTLSSILLLVITAPTWAFNKLKACCCTKEEPKAQDEANKKAENNDVKNDDAQKAENNDVKNGQAQKDDAQGAGGAQKGNQAGDQQQGAA